LAKSQEQRDSVVESSAGEPGPLSRLLQEVFEAPSEDLLDAWKRELQPGDRVGRFEIRREVGRGGFGAVYEAFDTELNRVVAVKTLRLSRPRRELSSDWIKKEAEAVARLDHPCIVTLHDVGTSPAGPYLVMELLRGRTLAQRIAEGPIPRAEALRIAEEMAKGLAHAHQRGVLHRDLKPANVFVCEDGRVKLLDFGLAHLLGTEGVNGAGTPAYMAPEQRRGEEVDQRADVYAAGRVLGDMLGERRPRRLEGAVTQATASDPANRPSDGRAWLGLLQAARHAVERPARMRRVAVLAGLGVLLGGAVVGVAVHRASRPTDPAHGNPSIAVLPFKDLSADRDQEYFADGVAEEILNGLAKVEGLKVIGRTSSFSFKGKDEDLRVIAQKLGVETVLEGSVRKGGNRIRVTAQLIRASDGAHLWSQTLDRDLADVFAIQDEISRYVVQALEVKVLRAGPRSQKVTRTTTTDAYNEYLLGQDFMRRGTLDDTVRALAAYEKVLALDPTYAPAWAQISAVHLNLETMSGKTNPDRRRRAKEAAERATELDPNLGQGQYARGWVRFYFEEDLSGALADMERAFALDPNAWRVESARARILSAVGRRKEAVAPARRATELEPLNAWAWWSLATVYRDDDDIARERAALERALTISPGHIPARRALAWNLVRSNKPAEALALIGAERPNESLDARAVAKFLLGQIEESRATLNRLIALNPNGGANEIATVFAWFGDRDRAFEWLDRALAQHESNVRHANVNPALRGLHDDPRWRPFLRKANLPAN